MDDQPGGGPAVAAGGEHSGGGAIERRSPPPGHRRSARGPPQRVLPGRPQGHGGPLPSPGRRPPVRRRRQGRGMRPPTNEQRRSRRPVRTWRECLTRHRGVGGGLASPSPACGSRALPCTRGHEEVPMPQPAPSWQRFLADSPPRPNWAAPGGRLPAQPGGRGRSRRETLDPAPGGPPEVPGPWWPSPPPARLGSGIRVFARRGRQRGARRECSGRPARARQVAFASGACVARLRHRRTVLADRRGGRGLLRLLPPGRGAVRCPRPRPDVGKGRNR